MGSCERISISGELQNLADSCVILNDRLSIYILSNKKKQHYPNTVYAIGSARKAAFSVKGAGGGSEVDLDDFDEVYHQMFLVDRSSAGKPEIVGGYRFYCQEPDSIRPLDMNRLFNLEKFYQDPMNMPAIELGRSFITPRFQKQPEVFYALFSGLGVILNLFDAARFFFGKITFYPANPWNGEVMGFLSKYHRDSLEQIIPRNPYIMESSQDTPFDNYTSAFKKVREHMPEILKIYLRFTEPKYALISGASANEDFGEGIVEAAFRIYIPAISDMWLKKFFYASVWVREKKHEFIGEGL